MILEPNESERQWLQAQVELAARLASRYVGSAETLPSLRSLDATLMAWSQERETQREDANTITNALGLAFGQHLVDRLNLAWVVVSDESGTEIAVHGQPGDILVFPTNALAKRVANHEYRCLELLFERMSQDVGALRAQRN